MSRLTILAWLIVSGCECACCTGAVVVVNSEKCLLWLEKVLESLWIPRGDTPTPYRGLPLVILALDDSIPDSKLREKPTYP